MLRPILRYVEGRTLLRDLAVSGIRKVDDKDLVRWRVNGLGLEASGKCWEDRALFQTFTAWYEQRRVREGATVLCMVSGEETIPAKQHAKGIIPMNGNAKLISANDSSNFTYRGRFTEESQAATVGYEASQKAHNALRWLAAEQGTVYGGRTFLCWNPQGRRFTGRTSRCWEAWESRRSPPRITGRSSGIRWRAFRPICPSRMPMW